LITEDRRKTAKDRRENEADRRQTSSKPPWPEAPKVTVIISACNEAERIGAVIGAAKACHDVDEVIVVDDGSDDDTAEVAGEYKITLLRMRENIGKGGAMAAGVKATDADILVFVDADLLGLRPRHLSDLIRPMLEDDSIDSTGGRFIGGRLATDLSQKLMPSINSQRAIRRSALEKIPDFSESRFGVETIINTYLKNSKANVLEVPLTGVAQVLKEEKRGFVRGAANRAKMYGDIMKHSVKKTK
jgi:glycosyltransferase involved in cell wall biosynthesis